MYHQLPTNTSGHVPSFSAVSLFAGRSDAVEDEDDEDSEISNSSDEDDEEDVEDWGEGYQPASRKGKKEASASHSHYPSNSMYQPLGGAGRRSEGDSAGRRNDTAKRRRQSRKGSIGDAHTSSSSSRGSHQSLNLSLPPAPPPWSVPPLTEGRMREGGMTLTPRDFETCCAFALAIAFPDCDGLELGGPCEVSLVDRVSQARLKMPCRYVLLASLYSYLFLKTLQTKNARMNTRMYQHTYTNIHANLALCRGKWGADVEGFLAKIRHSFAEIHPAFLDAPSAQTLSIYCNIL